VVVYSGILEFWFEEIAPSQWWTKDAEFDQLVVDRFSAIHSRATRCELFEWRKSAEGRLAEVIVLDQFSRNMFRGSAQCFAYDPLALVLSQEAISQGADNDLDSSQRPFLYMPLMHSESIEVHDVALDLFARKCSQDKLKFEIRHRDIIQRFHRYPYRNEILGRESTEDELRFLKEPGSSF
jgi:uncharacterized protein (DUF924 family)